MIMHSVYGSIEVRYYIYIWEYNFIEITFRMNFALVRFFSLFFIRYLKLNLPNPPGVFTFGFNHPPGFLAISN